MLHALTTQPHSFTLEQPLHLLCRAKPSSQSLDHTKDEPSRSVSFDVRCMLIMS